MKVPILPFPLSASPVDSTPLALEPPIGGAEAAGRPRPDAAELGGGELILTGGARARSVSWELAGLRPRRLARCTWS